MIIGGKNLELCEHAEMAVSVIVFLKIWRQSTGMIKDSEIVT